MCHHDFVIGGDCMKIIAVVLISVLLIGCSGSSASMDRALLIRSHLQNGGCEFLTTITADYQDYLHTFRLGCKTDGDGNLNFTVLSPETIAGITGQLSADGGKLTFDDHALLFSVLSEGLLSPVSAPWVFLNALKGGYISGAGEWQEGIKIEVDDTYEENALKLIVYTDAGDAPIAVDIYWQGQRIIEMVVESFGYL